MDIWAILTVVVLVVMALTVVAVLALWLAYKRAMDETDGLW